MRVLLMMQMRALASSRACIGEFRGSSAQLSDALLMGLSASIPRPNHLSFLAIAQLMPHLLPSENNNGSPFCYILRRELVPDLARRDRMVDPPH